VGVVGSGGGGGVWGFCTSPPKRMLNEPNPVSPMNVEWQESLVVYTLPQKADEYACRCCPGVVA